MKQADHFSLLAGGPFYRLARRVGLPADIRGFTAVGVALALIAWVPLLVLAAVEHHLTSQSAVPFLQSHATHARLLVAIPLFFLAEGLFDARTREAIRSLHTAIRPAQRARFDTLLERSMRRRDSWLIDGVAIALTVLLTRTGAGTGLPDNVTSWLETAPGRLTLAGWWFFAVSLPISRFVVCRWVLHLLRWWWLMWRLCRLDLQLFPTHPDRAAGLGVLGATHLALWPVAAGASAMVVTVFAEEVLVGGAEIQQFAVPLVGFIGGVTLVLVAPLFLFSPRLFEVKQRGLFEYGRLAEQYVRAFDTKWLRGGSSPDEFLGSADVQSLADLSSSLDVVGSMRFVPLMPSQILMLVLAAALPMVPLVLFVVPFDQLILQSLKAFLHL